MATRPGDQVQHAELDEHVRVPVDACADQAGQTPHPVGERSGAGIDEPGRQLVPGLVVRERRVGQTGPHAIFEPAIELGQSFEQPGDAFVAGSIELVAVGRGGLVGRDVVVGRVGLPAPPPSPADGAGVASGSLVARAEPGRDRRRRRAVGDAAADPEQQQCECVLARHACGSGMYSAKPTSA